MTLILDSPTDDAERRINASADVLFKKMTLFAQGRDLDESLCRDLKQLCDDHRAAAIARGIRGFPEIVVFPLVRQKRIEGFRRDLADDHQKMSDMVYRMIAKYPGIQGDEIAFAIKYAWPHYKPSRLLGPDGVPVGRA